ncbi:MAG: hypothetical protein ACLFVU_14940 [Phycisphaerae bacterium]
MGDTPQITIRFGKQALDVFQTDAAASRATSSTVNAPGVPADVLNRQRHDFVSEMQIVCGSSILWQLLSSAAVGVNHFSPFS